MPVTSKHGARLLYAPLTWDGLRDAYVTASQTVRDLVVLSDGTVDDVDAVRLLVRAHDEQGTAELVTLAMAQRRAA